MENLKRRGDFVESTHFKFINWGIFNFAVIVKLKYETVNKMSLLTSLLAVVRNWKSGLPLKVARINTHFKMLHAHRSKTKNLNNQSKKTLQIKYIESTHLQQIGNSHNGSSLVNSNLITPYRKIFLVRKPICSKPSRPKPICQALRLASINLLNLHPPISVTKSDIWRIISRDHHSENRNSEIFDFFSLFEGCSCRISFPSMTCEIF